MRVYHLFLNSANIVLFQDSSPLNAKHLGRLALQTSLSSFVLEKDSLLALDIQTQEFILQTISTPRPCHMHVDHAHARGPLDIEMHAEMGGPEFIHFIAVRQWAGAGPFVRRRFSVRLDLP